MVPKVSSVVLENNTANDGSKILRVSGSNLDYVGSVVVNGCAFYTVKGGANQIPFYVEDSKFGPVCLQTGPLLFSLRPPCIFETVTSRC